MMIPKIIEKLSDADQKAFEEKRERDQIAHDKRQDEIIERAKPIIKKNIESWNKKFSKRETTSKK